MSRPIADRLAQIRGNTGRGGGYAARV